MNSMRPEHAEAEVIWSGEEPSCGRKSCASILVPSLPRTVTDPFAALSRSHPNPIPILPIRHEHTFFNYLIHPSIHPSINNPTTTMSTINDTLRVSDMEYLFEALNHTASPLVVSPFPLDPWFSHPILTYPTPPDQRRHARRIERRRRQKHRRPRQSDCKALRAGDHNDDEG
jgi:hypothetical protein